MRSHRATVYSWLPLASVVGLALVTSCGQACPTIACPEEFEFNFTPAMPIVAPLFRVHVSDSAGGDFDVRCEILESGPGGCETPEPGVWAGQVSQYGFSLLRTTDGLSEGALTIEVEILEFDGEGNPSGRLSHSDSVSVRSQINGSGNCEYECLEAEPLVVEL